MTLRFDPARPDAAVTVIHAGQTIGRARQVDLYANCFVKRHPNNGTALTDREPEPSASQLSLRELDSDGDADGAGTR